ncbi:MAG: hypothetical protein ACOZIN_14905 [Myxococcota bacterium]
MTRILAVATAVLMTACGVDRADTFRKGVPQAKDVAVNVPSSSGQALSSRQDGLEGERAGFYTLTRGVTVVINAGTVAVLGLVKAIVNNPPTSVRENTAVWGPHTDALSPNTYKFTVIKNAENDYSYTLEGKGKNAGDDAYVVILSGAHKVAADAAGNPQENYGNGTFLLDWDAAATLPEHGKEIGSAEFTYSRLSASADIRIDVEFKQVKDEETGSRVDASYRYLSTPAAGGSFDFKIIKNLDNDPAKPALEVATIRSRWTQQGAGRADVKAVGGDIPSGGATASECWDENFASRYVNASFAPSLNYGVESVCAFATAEYSSLSL